MLCSRVGVEDIVPVLDVRTFRHVLGPHVTHWLLMIDDPSGLLIRWKPRLAEFDYEVQYKKHKINDQAKELSRLHMKGETVPNDNNSDIAVFEVNIVSVPLRPSRSANEFDFSDSDLGLWTYSMQPLTTRCLPTSTASRSSSKNYYKHNLTTSSAAKLVANLTRGSRYSKQMTMAYLYGRVTGVSKLLPYTHWKTVYFTLIISPCWQATGVSAGSTIKSIRISIDRR